MCHESPLKARFIRIVHSGFWKPIFEWKLDRGRRQHRMKTWSAGAEQFDCRKLPPVSLHSIDRPQVRTGRWKSWLQSRSRFLIHPIPKHVKLKNVPGIKFFSFSLQFDSLQIQFTFGRFQIDS